LPRQYLDRFTEIGDRNERDIRNYLGLFEIFLWEKDISLPEFASQNGGWECSGDGTNLAVEGEFPEKETFFHDFCIIFHIFGENTERDGEIVEWSFFP
jgi:hypothetical protein